MDEANLKKILRKLGISVTHKSGSWLNFPCPFAKWTHKKGTDNSPSCGAHINTEGTSAYKCLSCHKHGRISSLVRSLEYYSGTNFKRLALEADKADAQYSFGDFEAPEEEFDVLPDPLSEAAYKNLYGRAYDYDFAAEYLESRGISEDTARFLNLGYDEEDIRIVFPVRHTDKRLYGFTGRSCLPDKKFPEMYSKYQKVRDYLGLPKRHLLLGAERVDPSKPNFVVEGLFGWAHLYEIGADEICNPLALLGSELTKSKANLLMDWNMPTILAFDNDEGGQSGLFGPYDTKLGDYRGGGAIDKLYEHIPLIVPAWPKGKKDPDELTFEDVEDMLEAPLWHEKKKKKKYGR